MREPVTECCSNCNNEIDMDWDIEQLGYKAYCPVCGDVLMLCSECLEANDNETGCCDWSDKTQSCFRIIERKHTRLMSCFRAKAREWSKRQDKDSQRELLEAIETLIDFENKYIKE